MPALILMLAALNGFLAVGLGAFAAHGLSNVLAANYLATFETAVDYHMYHALALFGVAVLMQSYPSATTLRRGGMLFQLGIILFSGSLYLLSITGIGWLGAITPLGGLCFLLAWALIGKFGYTQYRQNSASNKAQS